MANASVQLAVDPDLRGRVMGLYMLVFIGGTPIGAAVIGALTNQFGARAGMIICGAVPALAAAVVLAWTARSGLRRPPYLSSSQPSSTARRWSSSLVRASRPTSAYFWRTRSM